MTAPLPMLRQTGRWAGVLAVVFFIAACASSTDIKQPNALISAAQNMERRAAQAYAAGDADSAATTYESAALVYESLALAEPMARARLSAARAVAEADKPEQALAIISAVLSQSQPLSAATHIVAHGRAAALYLAQGSAPSTVSTTTATSASYLASATSHWQSATALCAQACAEQAALWVLRSRIDLAQGNAIAAVQSASAALAVAQAHKAASAEQANALRARAQAHSALNQHAQTVVDATAALALDQDAGSAVRVQADLQLLAKAYAALGNADQAARYAQLATRAQAASRVLQQGAP